MRQREGARERARADRARESEVKTKKEKLSPNSPRPLQETETEADLPTLQINAGPLPTKVEHVHEYATAVEPPAPAGFLV